MQPVCLTVDCQSSFFYGELIVGGRPRHKPREMFKDWVINNLKDMKFDVNWEKMVENHTEWRKTDADGCKTSEVKKFMQAELKRCLWKGVVKRLDANIMIS